MSDVKCEGCGNVVKVGERFAAIRADEKWRVMHDSELTPDSEFYPQPRFVMTAARLWVLGK
jgi:hypothetical protein